MLRLFDFLDYHAREHPEAEFAVCGPRRLTYAEARNAANRFANALIESGLGVGDRVAILGKNCLEYPILYFGAAKAGVVPVPLNFRLAPPEWAYIVNDAGAKLLIAAGPFVQAAEPLRRELPSGTRYVAIGASLPGWEDYDAWVGAQPATDPDRGITADHDLYQMYTSGTTGRPKGAVVLHGRAVTNLLQCMLAMPLHLGDRFLMVAPYYHTAAATCSFLAVAGGGSLFIQEDFNPVEVIRALSEESIHSAMLVPAMIQACLVMVPGVAERQYPALKRLIYAASPIAEQTLRRAIEVFKCDFVQAYGMTESGPVLTLMLPEDHRRAMASRPELLLSAGRAVAGVALRIVDGLGNPLPPGEMGEITARGPMLMKGYWNMPEATAETLRDGWIHTGDAGTLDAEGYLYIQDRVKDMIVSGGENIYPRTVEEVLFRHPAIADAAVIGVPDQQWGETVKAVVVLREGQSATEAEIIEFARGQLGHFQCPRSVDFVSALPRNPSGKVLKRELREPYWRGHTRRVAGA